MGLAKFCEQITPEIAGKYYAMIQKTYQPTTWGRRIKQVKTMFSLAVSFGWISRNPFEKFRGTSPANRSRDFFVTPEIAKKVLDACPNTRLKLVFAFARWGGLRMPSEIAFMQWSDIDWDGYKIKICIPKKTTKTEQEKGNFKTRFIPLFPEIREALEAYRAEIPPKTEKNEGNDLIFPGMSKTESAGVLLRKQFREVLKQVGIPEWPKFFMNLRATRDTELQQYYPLHLVCEWIGHSPDVSLKHYTQVTAEDFKKASTRNEGK